MTLQQPEWNALTVYGIIPICLGYIIGISHLFSSSVVFCKKQAKIAGEIRITLPRKERSLGRLETGRKMREIVPLIFLG
jgi:hypothetical protein